MSKKGNGDFQLNFQEMVVVKNLLQDFFEIFSERALSEGDFEKASRYDSRVLYCASMNSEELKKCLIENAKFSEELYPLIDDLSSAGKSKVSREVAEKINRLLKRQKK